MASSKKKSTDSSGRGPGISVRVEPELHKRAKVHAAQAGRELKEVVGDAIAEYLKKHG